MTGLNRLAIVRGWGSYVFLGFVLTSAMLELCEVDAGECEKCGACVAACPSGALSEAVVDPLRCLSAISQKRGALSREEERLLAKSPLIWGCDECQRTCPHNASPQITPIPEFRDKVAALELRDIERLTNRAFREKYRCRAFTWRGVQPLLRNLILKKSFPHPPVDSSG